ncbi:toxin [Mariprofundus sp. EBB-1]|uniref:SpvB/TcaC N-terminal domain-containing protein n=1 Tax=Mariprofundus sp. EBB-1 TaxID=2650971 RepID=UPI000EF23831|nr:SpvB/TcaC N-terminal domain-containing protein [Mariprofundus sp. EBB-1]RLL55049.1 toxin [Mariprofundus sp. EBB-1]
MGMEQENQHLLEAPEITLPKGGGAIKGVAEKFEVNAVNGSASFQIPLPISPARNGFAPSLSLSYNSGSGNGPFGLGWSISIPSIVRKTEKGLPTYQDDDESDEFLLAGAEDMVPSFRKDTTKVYEEFRSEDGIDYRVKRYRPRIEGLFARIEQWSRISDGDIHWRSISGDNVTSIYGKDEQSRIADPADPSRIFQWLIEFTYNDKGSCAGFEYKAENLEGVKPDDVWEKNRLNRLAPVTNRYLKRVSYCSHMPFYSGDQRPSDDQYHFHLLMDYGEHDQDKPELAVSQAWAVRHDPFSQYRSGFEVRTYRRCQRVLMFHAFQELGETPCLVKSVCFQYTSQPGFSFLDAVEVSGHIRKDDGFYNSKSMPPVSFEYQSHAWNSDIQELETSAMQHAPVGLSGGYQWTDLFSEGVSGILTEQAGSLYYKHNLGSGSFAQAKLISPKPSFTGIASGALQLVDLESRGEKQLAVFQGDVRGFFGLSDDEQWQPFKAFKTLPNINFSNPNLKWLDVDGDGKADLLISEENVFRWYPSKGKEGFAASRTVLKEMDEEQGPAILFADATQSIYLASMSGSGMQDIVRIRNAEVCYWPNLGYGRFGAKVTMGKAPLFDAPDMFNPQYLRLGDIDGSGTTDIVYLGKDSYRCWLNDSGNQFAADPFIIDPFPTVDSQSRVDLVDLLGTGTACIVWSSPLPAHQGKALRYIDLMQGKKPHVLKRYENGMGAETLWHYKSSTHFYLEDKRNGTPWVTKLPFPVQVVASVEKRDHITGLRFASEYSYHHGYYDHAEREFRGFGRVDQKDCESFEHFVRSEAANIVEEDLHQPPVITKTWFHTGAYLGRDRILNQFAHEYYQNELLTEHALSEPALPDDLTTAEWREALRAFKGQTLRSETYALDGSEKEQLPYVTSQSTSLITQVQAKGENRYGSFMVTGSESISYHYERNPADPRISHSLVLESDEYGNPLKSAEIVYPRREVDVSLPAEVQAEQGKLHIVIAEADYTHDIDESDCYRLRVGWQQRSYELTGSQPADGDFFSRDELLLAVNEADDIAYEEVADGSLQKRLLKQSLSLLMQDDFSGPLPAGEQGRLGLSFEAYQLAFTDALLGHIYDTKVDAVMLTEGGYLQLDGYEGWWVPSGRAIYPPDARSHFYIPIGVRDPFGSETIVSLDDYDFLTETVIDAIDNQVSAENDYRTLQPVLMTDANLNQTAVETDALGFVTKSAVMGKAGEGDTLEDPSARMDYDLDNWIKTGKPNYVHSMARERHGDADTPWQHKYEYSDGFGNVVMAKMQAEPDHTKPESERVPRWIGNGRTVLNNKGKPIKQYEPFFSDTHLYEDEAEVVETGVTPIIRYDSLDRQIRTDLPNGTFTKVEFDPWKQVSWDVNDTVLESRWYGERNASSTASAAEKRAASLAAKHANTPAITHIDSLGRAFYAIADNGDAGKYVTRTIQDIEGNPLSIIDDRGNAVMQYRYSMLPGGKDEGTPALYELSMDAGEKWGLINILGNPVRSWDSRNHTFRSVFDELHRPVERWMQEDTNPELLIGKTIYGENTDEDLVRNLNGQVKQVFDQAGMVESHLIDFKGNLLHGSRRLAREYKGTVDWSAADFELLLEDEVFESRSAFDALNRPRWAVSPDGSITAHDYSERGALKRVRVSLKAGALSLSEAEIDNVQLSGDLYVKDICYDAKGQRQNIWYGNGATTKYSYDPETFRLTQLLTTRHSDSKRLQDLNYTYDPTGNITEIRDEAQQVIFFNNCKIEPHTKYEYDALYRLTSAKGRELKGLAMSGPNDDAFFKDLSLPGDHALVEYTQIYKYDGVGNILTMNHSAGENKWVRQYQYANDSNRLLSTSRPGETEQQAYADEPIYGDIYTYNIHGSMTSMPHLPQMQWDFQEQLCEVDLGGGGTAHYVYDTSGQRVRKVVQTEGILIKERIYLGGWEVYRERKNGALTHERETLHVMDDKQRIALIETQTAGEGQIQEPAIRYQFGNHLGSASLELDESSQIITYEEYHPYGTSAYRSGRSEIEVGQKRYRYTGMEKDEETGFSYHTARYLCRWIGRWIRSDPKGVIDGVNLFSYVDCNPVIKVDPSGLSGEVIYDYTDEAGNRQIIFYIRAVIFVSDDDVQMIKNDMIPGYLKVSEGSDQDKKHAYFEARQTIDGNAVRDAVQRVLEQSMSSHETMNDGHTITWNTFVDLRLETREEGVDDINFAKEISGEYVFTITDDSGGHGSNNVAALGHIGLFNLVEYNDGYVLDAHGISNVPAHELGHLLGLYHPWALYNRLDGAILGEMPYLPIRFFETPRLIFGSLHDWYKGDIMGYYSHYTNLEKSALRFSWEQVESSDLLTKYRDLSSHPLPCEECHY